MLEVGETGAEVLGAAADGSSVPVVDWAGAEDSDDAVVVGVALRVGAVDLEPVDTWL